MAIHCSVANNMGGSTLSGSTITNTGMQVQDHMQLSQDTLSTAGVIGDFNSVRIVQRGAGANRSVDVSAGVGYIQNVNYAINNITQNKFWRFINDAAFNVAINTNASGNPRITSIFAQFLAGTTPDGTASNVVTFVAVDGTPAASPVAPAAPVDGNSYLRLANVTCANGFASIVTANIADTRIWSAMFNIIGHEGEMFNGKLAVSVSTNNLTVSVVTADGSTPSVTNPVGVIINNTFRLITAALTKTINSGTNWFNSGGTELATKEIDYFAYLGWDSTNFAVRILWSRINSACLYSDFSGTSTNEKYAAFDTAPGASDSVVVIGRFAATLSATASFNWSVPTFTEINLIQRPIFETRVLTYQPVYSASGSMTWGTVTTTQAEYKLVGNLLWCHVNATGTTGGVANNELVFTLPFNTSAQYIFTGPINDTSFLIGYGYTAAAAKTVNNRKFDASNYGLGASRQVQVSSTFPV